MTLDAPRTAVADTSVLLAAFNHRDQRHDRAVEALNMPRVLMISPLVMAELDYLLHRQACEAVAVDTVTRLVALAGQGIVHFASVDRGLYVEAEEVLRRHKGMRLGLTDAANVVLAHRLHRPAIASFDGHYLSIAPRSEREQPLWVAPGPSES
ncbi:type II toxin-antitoxin system VapC family toxin [Streptacidiphilus fuscans]|uniref:Ribonuclease VapC n=1 Tax=Streptacidiphilus fuscans TaxID=2789292 RepID=A0A931FCD9_9ACTN|nr:PIN domain-containing protein [Streptacidiphilus fuscans]MBF9069632.1 type II toxin-antitoxin system VapC family toxin [Streptacidiphilus fuscans]